MTRFMAAAIPPRSAPGHFSLLCKGLEQTNVGGEAPLSGLLHGLAGRIKRRGLIVILSDGFDKLGDLTASLRHLRQLQECQERVTGGSHVESGYPWQPRTNPVRRCWAG